jgi:hypothetical protein
MSNEEMERKARRYMPQLFVSEYDKLKKRVLSAAEHIVTEIAENEEMRSIDPGRMTTFLIDQISEFPFVQFMYATDMEGVKITKNVTQIEDKAKYAGYDEISKNYADRSWFLQPTQTGKVCVTDVYTSKVTDRLTITVSSPIYTDDDEMVGVLGIDVRFEELFRLEEE